MSEELYAEHIKPNATYLGHGDLALLAKVEQVEVMMLEYTNDVVGVPRLASLRSYLNNMTGSKDFGEPDGDLMKTSPHRVWNIAWVSASYQRGDFLSINHALPLFDRAQIGGSWDVDAKTLMDRTDHKIKKFQSQVRHYEEDSEDEALAASFKSHVQLHQRKRTFFQLMTDLNLLPVDVPADGNCLLWSVGVCRTGPVEKWNDPSRMASMRSVAWPINRKWFKTTSTIVCLSYNLYKF